MIDVPTRAELLRQGQALLSALDSTLVVTKDSDAGIKLQLIAEALFGVHYNIGQIQDDLFVSERTSTEALELHAEARLEGGRKGATLASASDCLQVSGTDGSTAAVGDQLVSTDGTLYQLTTGGTIASGVATVSVEAITAGEVGNRDSGETLTFVTPPSGIDAEATLTAEIDGGEDQETDGELIKRLLDAYQNPLGSGRLSDYRQWAQAVEGVLGAYSYGPTSNAQEGRRGLGIVDVAILKRGSGSSRIPSTTVQDNVEDYIEDRRPACTRDFGVMLPSAVTQDVEVTIEPKTGYAFDWEKKAAVTVDGYTAGTKTMIITDEIADCCTAAKPLAAGDRVLISDASGNWQEENTVASVTDNTPAGKATVVFESAFANGTPATGDEFEPAGPLTTPCLTAVQALFDALGPARGDAYDPEQDWDDELLLAAIDAAIMGVDGVYNCTIVTPGTDVTPTDNAPSGVPELLIPGALNLHPPLTT